MKNFMAACVTVGALAFSSLAAAVPFQTIGLSLGDPTSTAPDQLCVAGCFGTIEVDLDGESGIFTSAAGLYDITAVNITIPELGETFDVLANITAFSNVVESDGMGNITAFASLSTNGAVGNLTLSVINSDWTISGDLNGDFINGGGSAAAVPEPASLALLGAGLVGFGLSARRRKMRRG